MPIGFPCVIFYKVTFFSVGDHAEWPELNPSIKTISCRRRFGSMTYGAIRLRRSYRKVKKLYIGPWSNKGQNPKRFPNWPISV